MPSESESKNIWEAVKLVEQEKGTNPKDKYQPGTLRASLNEKGEYQPYMDEVIKKAEANLPKLEKEIKKNAETTHSPSLEHTNPEAYKKQKETEEKIESLREEIKKSLN